MIVEAATPELVRVAAENMRQRDRDEFMPLCRFHQHAELVDNLVARFGEHKDVVVAGDGHAPIAVGGMIRHRPNVATLLMFATDDLPRIGADLTRFIRQRLFPTYRAAGTHRIECVSIAGYDEVHRWLRVLGLKEEADLPGFGRDGERYVQFAWVADKCLPG